MKKRSLIKRLSIVGVCLVVLCALSVAIINITNPKVSLVLDSTCEFPCWNDIQMGKTSESDLLKIIKNVHSVAPENTFTTYEKIFQKDSVSDKVINFATKRNWYGVDSTGRAWILNDKVVVLLFGDQNTNLTLAKSIEKFGAPDLVYANFLPQGDTTPLVDILIIFKGKGIAVGFSQSTIDDNITPDQHITSVTIFDVSLYPEILDHGWLGLMVNTKLYPWKGYGTIKDKYWPPN